jgi:hypothetical protein
LGEDPSFLPCKACLYAHRCQSMNNKTRLIQALLMSSVMVFMATLVVTCLDLGPRPGFVTQWIRSYVVAWPVAAVTSYCVFPSPNALVSGSRRAWATPDDGAFPLTPAQVEGDRVRMKGWPAACLPLTIQHSRVPNSGGSSGLGKPRGAGAWRIRTSSLGGKHRPKRSTFPRYRTAGVEAIGSEDPEACGGKP